jgi:hypothetical protein
MSIHIDPSYLRYIHDGLNNGIIHAENASSLPDGGLISIYEEALPPDHNVKERKRFIEFFSVWAMLKKEVSVCFVVPLLQHWFEFEAVDNDTNNNYDKQELEVTEYILKYSNWFNSPVSGKYILYHERIRSFVIQRMSKSLIEKCYADLIALLENSIQHKTDDETEYFALEYLSYYLLDQTFLKNNSDKFYQFFENKKISERQKNMSNAFDWNKKDLTLNVKFSFSNKKNITAYYAALELIKIQQKEQNSFTELIELLKANNHDLLIERINSFVGLRKSKVILYLLHELLLSESWQAEHQQLKKIVPLLLDLFTDNETINSINWKDYYPIEMIYKYQFKLFQLDIQKFDFWNHVVNIRELIIGGGYHLELITKIINLPIQSSNYINNIELLFDQEISTNDFSRIVLIVEAIKKDGIKNIGSYKIINNKKIYKDLLKISCLNKFILNNIELRNSAIDFRKNIIIDLENNNIKLRATLMVFENQKLLGQSDNQSFYFSSVENLMSNDDKIIDLKRLLNIYPFVKDQLFLTNKILELAQRKMNENGIEESKKLDLLNRLIGISRSTNDLDALQYWVSRKIIFLENLQMIESKQKPKLYDLFDLHQQEDYNLVLFNSYLEIVSLNYVSKINFLIKKFNTQELFQNIDNVLKFYQFLIDNKQTLISIELEEKIRQKFSNTYDGKQESLRLIEFHLLNKNEECILFWKNKLIEIVNMANPEIIYQVSSSLNKLGIYDFDKMFTDSINNISDKVQKIKVLYNLHKMRYDQFSLESINNLIKSELSIIEKSNLIKFSSEILQIIKDKTTQELIIDNLSSNIDDLSEIDYEIKDVFHLISHFTNTLIVPDNFNRFIFKLVGSIKIMQAEEFRIIKKYLANLHIIQLELWNRFNNEMILEYNVLIQITVMSKFGRNKETSVMLDKLMNQKSLSQDNSNGLYPSKTNFIIELFK